MEQVSDFVMFETCLNALVTVFPPLKFTPIYLLIYYSIIIVRM